MTYSLEFDTRALKEWHKLGDTVGQQPKKKLATILVNLRIEANRSKAEAVAFPVQDLYAVARLVEENKKYGGEDGDLDVHLDQCR